MGPEDLYRRLQQHLDRMPVGFPATESGVEIRILQQLFSPEEAELALALSVAPEPPQRIHARLERAMTPPELVQALDRMAGKGLILSLGPQGRRQYGKLMWVIGMYERQLSRLTADLVRDADQYFREAFGKAYHTKKTTQMRVVPVNEALTPLLGVGTYEDIRSYVTSSPGPFAVMKCLCRHGKDLIGEPCRQTALRENCLTVGMAAESMAERGDARLISREEMLGLLDQADKEGLVLQPENTRRPLFICCCCGCCCGVLTSAKRLDAPAEYFSSNFVAVANPEACEACGLCRERCQMDAIPASDGAPHIDPSRCIGCALCVTACPSGALRLDWKPERREPVSDTRALYLKMLADRYGRLETAVMMGRALMGGKV